MANVYPNIRDRRQARDFAEREMALRERESKMKIRFDRRRLRKEEATGRVSNTVALRGADLAERTQGEVERFNLAKEAQAQTKISLDAKITSSLSNLNNANADLREAQKDVIADREMNNLNTQFRNTQVLMQKEDRKRRQDSLKMLNEMYLNGTDDEKELARNTLVGIDTSRQNAEMARMLQLQLNADANRISTLSAEVANRGRMLDVTSTSLAMFANPELQTYMNKQLGEAVTGDLFMQNIQRFAELAGTPIPQGTPIRGPETPSTMLQ
jgi:hypothetical protein